MGPLAVEQKQKMTSSPYRAKLIFKTPEEGHYFFWVL